MTTIFFSNYLLTAALVGFLAAQIGKALLHLVLTREFSFERLVGGGGMPSSHSSTVCALFVAAARLYGPQSPYFAITFILAAIVMYDAMGVRLETGKQAKVLNKILEDLREENPEVENAEKLKELVGHTPLQVLSGALLGVLVAILIPVF